MSNFSQSKNIARHATASLYTLITHIFHDFFIALCWQKCNFVAVKTDPDYEQKRNRHR